MNTKQPGTVSFLTQHQHSKHSIYDPFRIFVKRGSWNLCVLGP